jgi:cytochrome c peroxidase
MRRLLVALIPVLLLACKKEEAPPAPAAPPPKKVVVAPARVSIDPLRLGAFAALPAQFESADNAITEEKIALGRRLYNETKLSKSGTISCNSCHDLANYGVDNQPKSPGHDKKLGSRNSPSVYNAAAHVAQFWDGRAPNVEEQAKGPVLNPVEMGLADDKEVVKILKGLPGYSEEFKKAFPSEKEPVTFDNFAKAVGAFERKLVTPSRWDQYLNGKQDALTDDEKRGFNTFVDSGCTACHSGAYVGGAMYQKLGLVKPWTRDADMGRFETTKSESDKQFFKVPSLRNVEKTAPYFHDGSVAKLEEAVKLMASHQLGRELDDAQVASIVTWLKTLTGEIPAEYIKPPAQATK